MALCGGKPYIDKMMILSRERLIYTPYANRISTLCGGGADSEEIVVWQDVEFGFSPHVSLYSI